MLSRPHSRVLTLASVLLLSSPALEAVPALGASSDAALLQSYAGNYTGQGSMVDGSSKQTVRCRLNMQPSGGKLNYNGRCSSGGAGFSLTGIISYDSSKGAFVAVMSSSTANVSATVTGRRSGNGVMFSTRQSVTYQGRVRAVSSTMALTKGAIRIDFSAADPKTGKTTSGTIPFTKAAP